jgi:high-affinity Fe2+/Pb2+ permease
MSFRRPAVPSRGLEHLCFGFIAFLVLAYGGMGAMFFWRGMLGWHDALLFLIALVGSVVPMLILGYFLRRVRLGKVAELQEYERVLASLADQS